MDQQLAIRSQILMKIFEGIQTISTVEETEDILTKRLITKLDHISFGFFCEAPEHLETFKDAYRQFRVRFGLENPPIKFRN